MRSNRLHPLPDFEHDCPFCGVRLRVTGWCIPGMRNLADLNCPSCERGFYGDLRAGQAVYTPMLLEKDTGHVYDCYGVDWFASWLRESYAAQSRDDVRIEIVEHQPIAGTGVTVLNCIDVMYGHALLKLLNAQYHIDACPSKSLIVIVPHWLAWMVPDGAAQAWIVYLPLRRGTEWNSTLARKIHSLVSATGNAELAFAYSHPRPAEYQIEKFTRVVPFDLAAWDASLSLPTITFVWRDDRQWGGDQHGYVVRLAEALRLEWNALTFAVAGVADPDARFPSWIDDVRTPIANENQERAWCAQYARSQLAIGVHGSNMLLPSGHAGGTIELIGPDRWANFPQDMLFRDIGDSRELLFRYRFIPDGSSPEQVAKLASLVMRKRGDYLRLMNVSAP